MTEISAVPAYNPVNVPDVVVKHLAEQLAIGDSGCLARYCDHPSTYTHLDHVEQIRRRHGYCDFTDQPEHWRLVRWLYTRAWLSAERHVVLFDLATARLVDRKILLPGATTLARLVASVSDRAAIRLWQSLAELPDRHQRKRLESLLVVPNAQYVSALDRLRRPSVHISAPGMVDALARLTQFRSLGVTDVKLVHVPAGRVKVLARYGAAAKAQSIERMVKNRRVATLLAFARIYETVAQDDAVDLLNQLISASLRRADNKGEAERLRTIPDLDRAALRLRDAMRVVLDDVQPDEGLRAAIFALIARQQLEADVQKVSELSRGEDESHYYEHLINHYTQMRRFLRVLLETIEFRGSTAAQPVLAALAFLRKRESDPDLSMAEAPLEVLTKSWRKLVLPAEVPDHRFYTLCTLERLQDNVTYFASFSPLAEPGLMRSCLGKAAPLPQTALG